MKPRTLLLLLVLVAGLGAFVWFVERDLPGSDERAERAKKVLAIEPEELSRIAWRRGGDEVVLARAGSEEGAGWLLESPLSARAALAEVEKLIDLVAGMEKERTLEEGEPAQLGLAPPRAVLTLTTAEGERELRLGGAVPASSSMIVATGDGPPFFVVDGSLWTELERPAGEWRSRDVFDGEREEIARFSFESEEGRVDLARRGEDFWLEAPRVDLADEGTVSRFLGTLIALEVAAFVDDPDAGDLGLADPAGVLEIVRDDGSAWKLELGAAVEGEAAQRYAQADGARFVIVDALTAHVTRPAEEWRSLEWSTLKAFEVDALRVSDGEGEVSFARLDGQWERGGEPLDFNVVSDLLYAVAGTKAEALDASGFDGEPVLEITLNPGENEELLEVFEPSGDRYPARASGRDAGLWLGGDRLRDIRSRLADARAAEPLAPDSDAAEAGVEEPAVDGSG